MKGVNRVWADQLKHWDCHCDTPNGWKLARPYGLTGLGHRLKCAWLVFTGKADVLMWHHQ